MLLAAVASCLLTYGCGGAMSPGVPIHGKVLVNNRSIATGMIRFVPGEAGTVYSAVISDGAYQFPPGEGPRPGVYRVEIEEVDLATGKPSKTRLLPADFNTTSPLSADIKAEGDHRLNFEISTGPKKAAA